MKSILLPLALIPVLLTGCASSGGYYSDYPAGAYPPGYYDYGPYYNYGPSVGVTYYDGGGYYHHGYNHDYHHYDSGTHVASVNHGSFHNSRMASASHTSHVSGHASAASHTASVSSGSFHTGGGHGHH